MLHLLNNWFGRPFPGTLTAVCLGLLAYLVWRQYRDRARRRYYRQRERARREYWGFD